MAVQSYRDLKAGHSRHTQAHFLACYITLAIEHIIEHARGHRHSATEMRGDMRV